MANAEDLKKTLEQVDTSALSQTIDESVAARLGKPAGDEEE